MGLDEKNVGGMMPDERKGESGRIRDRGGRKDVTPACSLQMWRRVLY